MTVTQGKAIHWKDFFWGWKNYKPYCSTNTSCCCVRTCIPHVAGGLYVFSLFLQEWHFPPQPTFLFSASSAHVHLCESLPRHPGDPSCIFTTQRHKTFNDFKKIPTQPFFWIKDHADMLLLRKKGRKKYWAVKTNFLSVFAAERCKSNEQMEWKSSFWCRSTKSWLSELQLSWQEWNVVSLLFQFIKLKFKIMNLKLFRPNV